MYSHCLGLHGRGLYTKGVRAINNCLYVHKHDIVLPTIRARLMTSCASHTQHLSFLRGRTKTDTELHFSKVNTCTHAPDLITHVHLT